MQEGRLPTGVSVIDERLDGGLPRGGLVAYSAPPTTQSELLLYELTAQRETLYLTTLRSEEAVKRAFDTTPVDVGNPMVAYAGPETGFDELGDVCGRAGTGANIVVDTTGALERRDRGDYQAFLNKLHTYVRRTGGVAVLHCHRHGDPNGNREVTLGMADVTLELSRTVEGSDIEHSLVASKFRGGTALTEPINLELTDTITVDTTRDLA